MVAELFKKVELYECLGSVWGQRHQKGNEHVAPTVCATIAHFNRLTNCVTTSCLRDQSMRTQDRVRVVEHWIKVARECLSLNNFSVHAIVSALRSNPIHRLHKTWAGVSSKSIKYLKELCKKDTAVKRDLLIKKVDLKNSLHAYFGETGGEVCGSMGTLGHEGRRPWKGDVAVAAGLLSRGDELQH
ncbi:hypothetical protein H8959_000891 [Pygathrix nigripes]